MKPLILSLLFAASFPLHAAELPTPPSTAQASKSARVIWQCPEGEFSLPVEEKPTSKTFQLPTTSIKGKPIALRFRARFHWPVIAGVSRHLVIFLNGQNLNPQYTPILNRDPNGASDAINWKKYGGIYRLALSFAPSPEQIDERLSAFESEGQWYLIRVDDYLKPDAANKLVLENVATEKEWPGNRLKDRTGIVIEALSLVELQD